MNSDVCAALGAVLVLVLSNYFKKKEQYEQGPEPGQLCSRRQAYSDWCGSVGWALFRKSKHCWFSSQSGPVPGLRARSLVGGM